jgi:hypothetical protein
VDFIGLKQAGTQIINSFQNAPDCRNSSEEAFKVPASLRQSQRLPQVRGVAHPQMQT